MKQTIIESSPNTPAVFYDEEKECIAIEGRSIPENADEFYHYLGEVTLMKMVPPYPSLTFEFRLEYINSSSAKQILNYLKQIREKVYDGCACKVFWYFEEDDEAIQELGEHLKATLGIPFELISY